MAIFWKPSEQLELYHHGVKGMKWGVRRDRFTLDEKKANDISRFPARKSLLTGDYVRDKRQYKKQRKFEAYLISHLKFSKEYVKAVNDSEKFTKETRRDEYGELYSKAARDKAAQLSRKVDKEAFKLLKLDETKLTPIARLYIAEAVNDAYRRNLEANQRFMQTVNHQNYMDQIHQQANQQFMQTVSHQNYMDQLHQQQVTQMHLQQHQMMFNGF